MSIKQEWKEYYGRVRETMRIGGWTPGDKRFDEAWRRSYGEDEIAKIQRRIRRHLVRNKKLDFLVKRIFR